MVNILVVAHCELANSFKSCVENIIAKDVNYLHTIAVTPTDNMEYIIASIQKIIAKIGEDSEILILSDIYGATPSNIAQKLLKPQQIEMIAGLNLPMLIRAISYAKDGLELCIQKTLDGGLSGIIHVGGTKW